MNAGLRRTGAFKLIGPLCRGRRNVGAQRAEQAHRNPPSFCPEPQQRAEQVGQARASVAQCERFNWVVGAFLFDRDYYQDTILQLGPGFLGPGLQNDVHAMADTRTRSYAGFASGEYALTSKLKAELGLRYTFESKSVDYEQTATLPIPGFGDASPLAAIHYANQRMVALYAANPGAMRCLLEVDDAVAPFAPMWRTASRRP